MSEHVHQFVRYFKGGMRRKFKPTGLSPEIRKKELQDFEDDQELMCAKKGCREMTTVGELRQSKHIFN